MVRGEDIVKRVSYVARIVIDEGNGMQRSDINCSQGLNCVIGPSGSGKTLLLDILNMKLKGKHLIGGASNIGTTTAFMTFHRCTFMGPMVRKLMLRTASK